MVELPSHLTDAQLLESTRRIAADERTTTAALVAHLVEVDTRRLAVAAGHSLFPECFQELLLSEDAACTRTTAVRMARAFPGVLPMLADGRLNLSTLRTLAPHLTAANHAELLAEAAGKSKRSVEEMVARRFPQPVTTSIRRIARPQVAQPGLLKAVEGVSAAEAASAVEAPSSAEAGSPPSTLPGNEPIAPNGAPAGRQTATQDDAPPNAGPSRPPLTGARPVTPMAEDVFLIRLAASRAMVERLRRAQDLLGNAVPRADVTEVFDRALILLIEDLEKKRVGGGRQIGIGSGARRGAVRQPASPPGDRGARYIAVEVRRVVWERDGGRCAYVSPDGRRCEATRFLHFHHLRPFEVGGPPTIENIALRCRAHNQYEADIYFGPLREAMASHESLSAGGSIRPGTDGAAQRDDGTRGTSATSQSAQLANPARYPVSHSGQTRAAPSS